MFLRCILFALLYPFALNAQGKLPDFGSSVSVPQPAGERGTLPDSTFATVAGPNIHGLKIVESATCLEDSLTVGFTTEREYNPSNYFILQLSDAVGSFADPMRVAIVQARRGDYIRTQAFQGMNKAGYRFRIISTSPRDTSEEIDIDLPIYFYPRVTITPSSTYLCGSNDSVVLRAGIVPGDGEILAISWSTGDTGMTLTVRNSGLYTVSVFDKHGCKSPDGVVLINDGIVPELTLKPDKLFICEGDSLLLEPSGFGARNYLWSTGAQQRTITVRESGTYWVEGRSDHGCTTRSNSVSIAVVPPPPKPVLELHDDTLIAPDADAYQWYRNGDPIEHQTGKRYVVTADGAYSVGVRNQAGCETLSDRVEIGLSGVELFGGEYPSEQITIYPQPVASLLQIAFDSPRRSPYRIAVSDLRGTPVITAEGAGKGERRFDLSVLLLPPGTYLLRIETESGSYSRTIVKY